MKPELKVLTPEDAPKPAQDENQTPAQSEMPFAIVAGEPVTALPQDLYIPPYALQVFLEAFEGPLDIRVGDFVSNRDGLLCGHVAISPSRKRPQAAPREGLGEGDLRITRSIIANSKPAAF